MADQPSSTIEEVIDYTCGFEPDHVHELPGDWHFGGSDGMDPRSDARWEPSTYTYFDAKLRPIHVTQVPFCDDEAIDRFTQVASYGVGFDPVWITVRRPGERAATTLPVTYDSGTDTVTDKE